MKMHYSVKKGEGSFISMILQKSIALLIISMICFSEIHSQSAESISFRHVKGVQGIELSGGISDLGPAGAVYYSNCFSNRWYGKTGLVYEYKNDQRFSSWAMTADIAAARTLVSQKSVFISLLAGGSVVLHETLEGFVTENPLNTNGFGVLAGGEAEYYLSNRFVIVVNTITRYIINSDIGKQRFYATAGLKFIF